jgi:hypothetical protein
MQLGLGLLSALKAGLLGPASGLLRLQISVPMPQVHLAALSEGLQTAQSLRALSLEGSLLTDRGLESLKGGLLANTTLEELNLAGCALSDLSAFLLVTVLRRRGAWYSAPTNVDSFFYVCSLIMINVCWVCHIQVNFILRRGTILSHC